VRIRDVVMIDKDPEESQTESLGTVCHVCADVDESLGSSLKSTKGIGSDDHN
jgi:hypothetical protein